MTLEFFFHFITKSSAIRIPTNSKLIHSKYHYSEWEREVRNSIQKLCFLYNKYRKSSSGGSKRQRITLTHKWSRNANAFAFRCLLIDVSSQGAIQTIKSNACAHFDTRNVRLSQYIQCNKKQTENNNKNNNKNELLIGCHDLIMKVACFS